jgi:transcriptional antiterminator NusG
LVFCIFVTAPQFFVIQVLTGEESRYIRRVEGRAFLAGFSPDDTRLWWPRRRLFIRRRGKRLKTLTSLFPGYLFLETRDLSAQLYQTIRRTEGFVRFLPDNQEIVPLDSESHRLIRHFLSHGEVLQESRVYFDENNRIIVKEGPLKGLEGHIVKVDRRKRRAKVKLDLYEESFQIDLAFETMEPTLNQPNKVAEAVL